MKLMDMGVSPNHNNRGFSDVAAITMLLSLWGDAGTGR